MLQKLFLNEKARVMHSVILFIPFISFIEDEKQISKEIIFHWTIVVCWRPAKSPSVHDRSRDQHLYTTCHHSKKISSKAVWLVKKVNVF